MLSRMSRRPKAPSPALIVALAALCVALGGVAVASIPGPDGVVKSCYGDSTGALRVIDSSANCVAGETLLTFNQQGPPGPKGDPGPQGPQGAPPANLGAPPTPPLPPKLTSPPKKPGPKVLKQLGIPKNASGGGSEVYMAQRDVKAVPKSVTDTTFAELIVPAGRYYVTAHARSELTAGTGPLSSFSGPSATCGVFVGMGSGSGLVGGSAPQLFVEAVGRLTGPGRIELRCTDSWANLPAGHPLKKLEDPDAKVTLRDIRLTAISVKRYSSRKLK